MQIRDSKSVPGMLHGSSPQTSHIFGRPGNPATLPTGVNGLSRFPGGHAAKASDGPRFCRKYRRSLVFRTVEFPVAKRLNQVECRVTGRDSQNCIQDLINHIYRSKPHCGHPQLTPPQLSKTIAPTASWESAFSVSKTTGRGDTVGQTALISGRQREASSKGACCTTINSGS